MPQITEIKVRVNPDLHPHPVHQGVYTLARLKDAGVPVEGVLYVAGVSHGTLSMTPPDLVDGMVLWTWRADT